ncbi:hypothetical protein ACFFK7_11635 [Pseudoalteromonas xiamenensis]|uniref:hypothetical protein n=1 Tax=Pseudoalteromonas xiamenensis TaxID=882626 RepID=UPI0035EEAD1C
MKLSKEESQFLHELLDIELEATTPILPEHQDEGSNELLRQVADHSELLIIARMQDKEICFPLSTPDDVKKLYDLHLDLPHIVDISGFHRHWRITPHRSVQLKSQQNAHSYSLCSLSLSGALVFEDRHNLKQLKNALENNIAQVINATDEDIPVFISEVKARGKHLYAILFDELTESSPLLKNFLLQAFLKEEQS